MSNELKIPENTIAAPAPDAFDIASAALSDSLDSLGASLDRHFAADDRLLALNRNLLRLATGAWHLCESLLACREAIPDDSIRAMSAALRTAIDEASTSPATLAPSPAGAGAGNTAPAPPSAARYVEHVHCSRCGNRCSGVDPELGLVVRAWVECPECLEKSEGNSAKSEGKSSGATR